MATIKEDYVSFETAKLLKEKRFNEPCHATYDTAVTGGKPKFSEYEVLSYFPYGMKNSDDKYSIVISAPTLQMAMKWLREVHELYIEVSLSCDREDKNAKIFDASIFNVQNQRYKKLGNIQGYEQTCETAIKYCLENLI